MKDIRLLDSVMKTPGYIGSQMVTCGKSKCKCSKGKLHGPYFYYRYWKLHHKVWIQKKTYVTKKQAERIEKALTSYKQALAFMGEDQYRALRRGIKENIKKGIPGMTQRKLSSVSVSVKSFS